MQSNRCHVLAAVLTVAAVCGVATSTPAAAADKPTIELGYVQSWPSSSITTKLAADVLENDLRVPVKLVALSAGPMYQGVKSGDLDAMLTAWLPTTHKEYYEKVWPDVLNLGPNLRGTKLGLAVPSYVKDVDSIADLKKHADEFDGKIMGVGAGAGINEDTLKAIKQYGLDMQLVKSSTAGMAASLERAVNKHEPIVVTGWSPLWIWSKFDLKYLKDPKNVYGQAGYVATLASRALPDKAPDVYRFLDDFRLTLPQLNQMEAMAKGGQDEAHAVHQWAQNHPKVVSHWVAAATNASG